MFYKKRMNSMSEFNVHTLWNSTIFVMRVSHSTDIQPSWGKVKVMLDISIASL